MESKFIIPDTFSAIEFPKTTKALKKFKIKMKKMMANYRASINAPLPPNS